MKYYFYEENIFKITTNNGRTLFYIFTQSLSFRYLLLDISISYFYIQFEVGKKI